MKSDNIIWDLKEKIKDLKQENRRFKDKLEKINQIVSNLKDTDSEGMIMKITNILNK